MSSRIILGIDPGLATTGWGVIEEVKGAQLKVKSYGVIKTSSASQNAKRLVTLYQATLNLVDKFSPSHLAIEMLFFGKNAKTAMLVGQARGVVLLAAVQANLPVEEYSPLQIKTAITGFGRASKSQMQKMVQKLLQLKKHPTPDDAADALAVALTAAATNRFLK